ncbi:hypothetical protein GCM10027062_05240 [Nocardioides hungaricus]
MRRRTSIAVLVLTVVSVNGMAVASSGVGSGQRSPEPVIESMHFYRAGPEATYSRLRHPFPHSDVGIVEVDPLVLTTPTDASTYDAVATTTFRYRTRGPGPFSADVIIDTGTGGGDDGTADDVPTVPGIGTPLRASKTPTAGVVQVLVRRLAGGSTYRFSPQVDSVLPKRGTNRITTARIVFTVQLIPRVA